MPTLNLLTKSHQTVPLPERNPPRICEPLLPVRPPVRPFILSMERFHQMLLQTVSCSSRNKRVLLNDLSYIFYLARDLHDRKFESLESDRINIIKLHEILMNVAAKYFLLDHIVE